MIEEMDIDIEDTSLLKRRKRRRKRRRERKSEEQDHQQSKNEENKRKNPNDKLTKIERIYIGKLHRLADPNLIEEDLDKNNIFFDQRKYKYLSYAFLRNHYYEWSNVECESCKKKGYRHNPFMNSCEKAKEILGKIHEIL